MKKLLFIILIGLVLLRIIYINDEREIRVRVIPNSDNEIDLKIKEDVKDIVICYLEEMYDSTYSKYYNNIDFTYKYLEKLLDEKYDVSVSFNEHTLYNKTYNNSMIKNESYPTLLIVIGSGKGDNWWGSIYPEFLGMSGDDVIEYKSLFKELLKNIKEDRYDN